MSSDEPNMQRASVGRDVHYVARGSADGRFPKACRTAKVTEVPDGASNPFVVGLCVINPTGLFFHSLEAGGVQYDPGKAGGTWHWPERA